MILMSPCQGGCSEVFANFEGHVHKFEAVLWTFGKIEKNNFSLQNDQRFTKGVEISRKHVF